MKLYRNSATIIICCSLILSWMTLFIDASKEDENTLRFILDNTISQNTHEDTAPLFMSSSIGNLHNVQYLIGRGLDVNRRTIYVICQLFSI